MRFSVKFLVVVISVFIYYASAFAEVGDRTGNIKKFRTHDSSNPAVAPPYFWFTLENIGSAGGCYVLDGNVMFSADTNEMYSLVLAAYMASESLTVTYNTAAVGSDGYCNAVFITVGN
jgi:hypothetical protein